MRDNNSKGLDELWREFFGAAITGTAHKTQYTQMAIMRVFWGIALAPELDELYQKIRCPPTQDQPGHHVGWDMIIEWLNRAIKKPVDARVSNAQISNFIESWGLIEMVISHMREMSNGDHDSEMHGHVADATADVEMLVEYFEKQIGRDWRTATQPRSTPTMLAGPSRKRPPWVEIRDFMSRRGEDAPHKIVKRHVVPLTSFYPWDTS